MKIEICTHAYSGPNAQYAKLLAYQLNALVIWRPISFEVLHTTVAAQGDEPVLDLVRFYEKHWPGMFRCLELPRAYAFQRAFGRNAVAKATQADVVHFADADYIHGPGCIDSLSQIVEGEGLLYYPRETLICRDYAIGDRYIAESDYYAVAPLQIADFVPKREHRAIGGVQFVAGSVARAYGYCPNSKWQLPAPDDCDTTIGFASDRAFRISLGTSGKAISIPNLYRLRHSETGDDRAKRLNLKGTE